VKYVRDEQGEASLGVYHGPLTTEKNPRVVVDILGSNDTSDSVVVEDQHRVSGFRVSVRNYRRALGRLWRSTVGAQAR
jgi:hypothetical protein